MTLNKKIINKQRRHSLLTYLGDTVLKKNETNKKFSSEHVIQVSK